MHVDLSDIDALAQRLTALSDPIQEAAPRYEDTDWRTLAAVCAKAIDSLIAQRRSAVLNWEAVSRRLEYIEGERESMRAALLQLLACHTESSGFTRGMLNDRRAFVEMLDKGQEKVEAAIKEARIALGMSSASLRERAAQ